jgi:autotransporter-associated beta strand protein
MKPIPLRHSRRLFAIASICMVSHTVSAQQTKFANLNVVQNDAGNDSTSVTLSLAPGSSGGVAIRGGNRGDYDMNFAAGADRDVGVLITSVSQLKRDNTAAGDTIGEFFATSQVDLSGTPAEYFIPVHRSSAGGEININVSMAFFPYSQWIGGFARNSAATNGGATNQLFGSTGLALGTHLTTLGGGQFTLNIAGFNLGSYTAPALPSQNGILLVNHAKNEANFALSRANANGTFNLFVKDNGANGTGYEQDPVAFVYLPTTAVGTRNLVAMGRVNGDASTDIAGGSFTVTKGPTGTWYLTITGQTNETGTLIISAEGGGSNNVDNIVSYEWDGVNNRWIIESRDLTDTSTVPSLQNMANAAEDAFSFAFFQAPATTYISSSFTGANGDPVADANLGTMGNQPAVTGTSAFPTISGALTSVGSLAPLFLNGGTYDEAVDLGSEFLLTVTGTDTDQDVAINSLAGQAGSSFAILGGSSLTLGGDDATTVMDGPVSGGPLSSITKNGTGTISMNANNPFTGTLTINGGGVWVNDLGLGGDINADLITINNGGVFTFGGNGNPDLPNSTDVSINTGGRFELGIGENYGVVTLDGGEFRFISAGNTNVNNSAVAPAAGGTAYDVRSGSFTTSFSSGGTGGLLSTSGVLANFVKTTAGTATMGNGTSFSATMPVEVREGTLAFSGTHAVAGSEFLSLGTQTTAGTLRVDTGLTTINRPITTALGGSTVDAQAAGTLYLAGPITGPGPLAISSAGVLEFGPGAAQFQSVDVVLTGNSPIGKSDFGTTEFTAVSPFSGQIDVIAGVLIISGGVAGSVVVGDFGSLAGEGVIGGDLDLGVIDGGRLLVDASNPTTLGVDGTVNLFGTSIVGLSGLPSGTGSLSVPVLGYGTLTGFSSGALALEFEASYRPGSGVFTDDAANSRILMSFETKSLVWNGASGIWDLFTTANWQAAGAELFYYGDTVTFNDTSANAAVTLAGNLKPGSITVDSDITNYSLSGTSSDYISGATGLLKRGSSLLVMDAPNTFDGGTVIEEGVLEIRQLDALGFGPVALGSPSTGSANTAFYLGAQRINFGRAVTVSGGTGTATLGSRATITGTGDDNQFTSISLARDVIFDSNAADRTDYENITGTGNIMVSGTGRSVFPTTPALFAGDVRVSTSGTGSLQIGVASTGGDRIPDASAVTVDAGASLRISTSAETIGSLFGAGTVTGLAPSGGSAVLTIGSGNFSGLIDGLTAGNVLSLVKTGAGELVLSGNNNYGGTTTVSGGTLRVGNSGATGDLGFGAVTVAEGATLSYLRTGAVTQDGGLNSTGLVGASNLVIGGDSTTQVTLAAGGNFSGAINVNAGTLVFGATNPIGAGASAPSITLAPGATLINGNSTTHAHLGLLQLGGGSVLTTSSGTGTYNTENYQLNGNLTVSGGTTAALITRDASRTNANSGVSLRGTRSFNVADVTGSTAADLVVSTELEPSDLNTGADEGALVKQGAGTLQFSGEIAHSYTGPTVIEAGTLLANGSIPGSLTVSAGATLAPGASAGSFGAGATTIEGSYQCEVAGSVSDVLTVTGNLQLGAASVLNLVSIAGGFTEPEYVIATWTGALAGTFATVTGLPAEYTLTYDETNKRILLVGSGDSYTSWKTAQGIANAGALTDSDNDGISNGIEFVIGGDPSGPNSNSNALLPTATREGGFFKFVFRRTDESSGFNPFVEYSSILASWTKAVNGVNGVTIAEENDFYGLGIDRVTVSIPEALGTTELFTRLGVTIP